MSVRLMGAVFDLDIPRVPKFVLLAMADPAHDDGSDSYLAVGTIAKKASSSVRSVQQNIRCLAAAHYVEFVGKIHVKTKRRVAEYGHGVTAEYKLTPDKGDKKLLLKLLKDPGNRAAAAPLPLQQTLQLGSKNPERRRRRTSHREAKNPARRAGESNSESDFGTEPGSARNCVGCQDAESKPLQAVEKSERQFTDVFKATTKAQNLPNPSRPRDPLRAELYDGVFRKKIAAVFFDCREQPFSIQLETCVKEAVTSLMLNRTGKLMVLSADEFEARAVRKLALVSSALESFHEFERRRDQVVANVVNSVVTVAAEMLESLGDTGARAAVA